MAETPHWGWVGMPWGEHPTPLFLLLLFVLPHSRTVNRTGVRVPSRVTFLWGIALLLWCFTFFHFPHCSFDFCQREKNGLRKIPHLEPDFLVQRTFACVFCGVFLCFLSPAVQISTWKNATKFFATQKMPHTHPPEDFWIFEFFLAKFHNWHIFCGIRMLDVFPKSRNKV